MSSQTSSVAMRRELLCDSQAGFEQLSYLQTLTCPDNQQNLSHSTFSAKWPGVTDITQTKELVESSPADLQLVCFSSGSSTSAARSEAFPASKHLAYQTADSSLFNSPTESLANISASFERSSSSFGSDEQMQVQETISDRVATETLRAVVGRVALEDPDKLDLLLDSCAAGTTTGTIGGYSSIECSGISAANGLPELEEWQGPSASSTAPGHLQPQAQMQQLLQLIYEPNSSHHSDMLCSPLANDTVAAKPFSFRLPSRTSLIRQTSFSSELETQESAVCEAVLGLAHAGLTNRGSAYATSTRHPTSAQVTNVDTSSRAVENPAIDELDMELMATCHSSNNYTELFNNHTYSYV